MPTQNSQHKTQNSKGLAGIYLHIPFCKQACHYCDFHFSTSLARKAELVAALCREMALQQQYLSGREVNTVYFGGGTPSLLTAEELQQLLEALHRHFQIAPDAEITLEANPDDLTPEKLAALVASPVNRLSIGIQSFHGPHLQLMNRAHNATEAATCVQDAQAAGFDNISIDLIYGVPAPDHTLWQEDMARAFALGVQHLSCYALTIEPKTAFGNWTRKGRFLPAGEDFVAEQFEMLLEQMHLHGFEQYEISNFCRPGFHSRHNSNYWRGVPYLGLGPSAHSYSGTARQHNIASNAAYLRAISEGMVPATLDQLSAEDNANEYILTSLRTSWGCDLAQLQREHGIDLQARHQSRLARYTAGGFLQTEGQVVRLTDKGKLLADQIATDLFV